MRCGFLRLSFCTQQKLLWRGPPRLKGKKTVKKRKSIKKKIKILLKLSTSTSASMSTPIGDCPGIHVSTDQRPRQLQLTIRNKLHLKKSKHPIVLLFHLFLLGLSKRLRRLDPAPLENSLNFRAEP